jgi:hypothetical protein
MGRDKCTMSVLLDGLTKTMQVSEKHGEAVNKWVVSCVWYIRHMKVGYETDLYENVTVIGGRILVLCSSLPSPLSPP